MKMFFILLPAVVFGMTVHPRVPRQIWPAPANPNFYWDGPANDGVFYPENGDLWAGPPRFEQPPRDFGGFREDFNFVDTGNGNRRTTTEDLGPITSTPKTVHVAPQNCECPMTQQFNPVCGTDGNTYRNEGLLNCYARCGSNVTKKRFGTC